MSRAQTKTRAAEELQLLEPDASKVPAPYAGDARVAAFLEALGRHVDAAVRRAVKQEMERLSKEAAAQREARQQAAAVRETSLSTQANRYAQD